MGLFTIFKRKINFRTRLYVNQLIICLLKLNPLSFFKEGGGEIEKLSQNCSIFPKKISICLTE